MTLIYERDLDKVKMNHHDSHLPQRSFSSKVILWTHTETRGHYSRR